MKLGDPGKPTRSQEPAIRRPWTMMQWFPCSLTGFPGGPCRTAAGTTILAKICVPFVAHQNFCIQHGIESHNCPWEGSQPTRLLEAKARAQTRGPMLFAWPQKDTKSGAWISFRKACLRKGGRGGRERQRWTEWYKLRLRVSPLMATVLRGHQIYRPKKVICSKHQSRLLLVLGVELGVSKQLCVFYSNGHPQERHLV